MAYTYYHKDNGYSRRHRTYEMADGSQITALVTRYTYQMFYKPAQGPRGGKARKECARSLYYAGGIFYRAYNAQREDGTYYNSLRPFEGTMWDCHQISSAKQGVPALTIECIEGVPVSAKDTEGREVWAWGEDIAALEDMLQVPEQDRAQQPEATEPEQQQTDAEQFEAARVAWITETSQPGDQLDLFAYAGYGDITWSELGRAGSRAA